MDFDLTCVITGHREGRLAVASLRSFDIAVDEAREAGYSVEQFYCVDTPDARTHEVFTRFAAGRGTLQEAEFGDQGLVRNLAVGLARGRYIAFLDGDDLWARDWLVRAMRFLAEARGRVIAHSAYNYFFEEQSTIFCQIDQDDPRFDLDLLRLVNYWDALCVCETAICREFPFAERAIDEGWAYEDWHWNCETLAAGIRHKVVPDTVLFKRRQKTSQTIRASVNRSRIRKHPLASYSSPIYRRRPPDG